MEMSAFPIFVRGEQILRCDASEKVYDTGQRGGAAPMHSEDENGLPFRLRHPLFIPPNGTRARPVVCKLRAPTRPLCRSAVAPPSKPRSGIVRKPRCRTLSTKDIRRRTRIRPTVVVRFGSMLSIKSAARPARGDDFLVQAVVVTAQHDDTTMGDAPIPARQIFPQNSRLAGGPSGIRTCGSVRQILPLKTRQNFALQSTNWAPEKISRPRCCLLLVHPVSAVRFFRFSVMER